MLLAAATLAPAAHALSDLEIRAQVARFRSERDQQTPLWQSAPLSSTGSTLGQYSALQALVNQTPLLSSLRDWRETLRGGGTTPVRRFNLGSDKPQSLALEVGARPLPISELAGLAGGITPSVGLTYGKIEFGSTAPLQSANRALRSFDELTAVPTPTPIPSLLAVLPTAPVAPIGQDESQYTWVTARPLEGKAGSAELMYVRGHRDITPTLTTGKVLTSGSFWGSRATLNLTPEWKLRGEFINSTLKASTLNVQPRSTRAWRTYLDGPVKVLPWGKTTLSAVYSDVDSGFASFTNPLPAEGASGGQVALLHTIAAGKLSGSLSLMMSRSTRKDTALLLPGTAQQTDGLNATTSLRYAMSPRVALTATQTYLTTGQQFVLQSPTMTSSSAQLTGDVGVEISLTPTIALAVTTGATQFDSAAMLLDGVTPTPISLRDEGRVNVSLRQTTAEGSWGVQVLRGQITDTVSNLTNADSQTVLLQGERQVLPWLRLKGSLNLAGQTLTAQQIINDRADRTFEAQLNLRKMGLLGIRYGDWNTDQSAPGLSALRTKTRQYGATYTFGAAAGQPGLALYISYDKLAVPILDQPEWRIGLSYQ